MISIKRWITILLVMSMLLVSGCAPSTGRPFPVQKVTDIQIGETTKETVRKMFGEPWRTGIEDGLKTWTYGQYSIKNSRDLLIRFDDGGRVKSYSFSSSFPEDKNL